MLTRRRFLRDLGTGLVLAAAAPLVTERKVWAVPRSAPVRDGAARFNEPRLSVRLNGVEYRPKSGVVWRVEPIVQPEPGVWVRRTSDGVERSIPLDADGTLNEEALEAFTPDGRYTIAWKPEEQEAVALRVLANVERGTPLSGAVQQQNKANLRRMLNERGFSDEMIAEETSRLQITFKR